MRHKVAFTCWNPRSRPTRAKPNGAYSKAVRKRSSRRRNSGSAALRRVTSSTCVMNWRGSPWQSRSSEVFTRAQTTLPRPPMYRVSNSRQETWPASSCTMAVCEAARSSGCVSSDQLAACNFTKGPADQQETPVDRRQTQAIRRLFKGRAESCLAGQQLFFRPSPVEDLFPELLVGRLHGFRPAPPGGSRSEEA